MRGHLPVIGQFRQNIGGQLLAEFHAPLVKAENVPDHALGEDFVLIHGDQASQDPGCELFKQYGVGRLVAVEPFVRQQSADFPEAFIVDEPLRKELK